MSRVVRVWVGLVGLLLSGTAGAQELTSYEVMDPPTLRSLRIEAPEKDVPICVVLPSVQGMCEGVDSAGLVAQTRAKLDPKVAMLAMALLRYEDFAVVVMVTRMRHSDTITDEWIEGFMRGVVKPAQSAPGSRIVKHPYRIKLAGAEGVKAEIEIPAEGETMRTWSTAVFASDQLHAITYLTPAAEAETGAGVVAHIDSTLSYNPGEPSLVGRSSDFVRGYRLGLVILPLIGIAVMVIIILRDRLNKRQRT